MKYIVFALIVIYLISYTNAAAAPAFTLTKEANNSNELDLLIEGGKDDLYIVNFYMPGDNHEEVKAELEEKIAGNSKYKDLATYVEVNAARTYQYKDVLQDVGIYNKPSNMYPYVLVIKKGEGYLFRGASIGDLVLKKIASVVDSKVDFSSEK